ncbi:hypothetical protein TWF718_005782 [Orbilia javanica]|uniref:Uncharacterized protein n=1 Tax=Orbilia javanica TaxID=47235 RepID=A0AAN8MZH3_9PEZI
MNPKPGPSPPGDENVAPREGNSGVGPNGPASEGQLTLPPPRLGAPGAFFRGHRRSRVVLGSRQDLGDIDFSEVFRPVHAQNPSSDTAPEVKPKKERKSVRFSDDAFEEWLRDFEDL